MNKYIVEVNSASDDTLGIDYIVEASSSDDAREMVFNQLPAGDWYINDVHGA